MYCPKLLSRIHTDTKLIWITNKTNVRSIERKCGHCFYILRSLNREILSFSTNNKSWKITSSFIQSRFMWQKIKPVKERHEGKWKVFQPQVIVIANVICFLFWQHIYKTNLKLKTHFEHQWRHRRRAHERAREE